MEKGRIIFLNGVTSTGKTSIAGKIQELSDVMYYHVSNDMFHRMAGKKIWKENSRECISKSIITMYYAIKGMCENGVNVIIDGMLLEMPEYVRIYGRQHYDIMQSVLAGIVIFMVEVFGPLEECRRRNIARGDRGEYQSEQQNEEMNKSVKYDLKVNTFLNSANECAEQILIAAFIHYDH